MDLWWQGKGHHFGQATLARWKARLDCDRSDLSRGAIPREAENCEADPRPTARRLGTGESRKARSVANTATRTARTEAQRLVRVASEPSLDLLCDGPPKIEPLPEPRTPRSLLLQKGELACSGQTMLIAQTLNHGQHAHTVRNRLHFGQL